MIFKYLGHLLFRSRSQRAFNNVYEAAKNSKAFEQYCVRVHGQHFIQFNTLCSEQFQLILNELDLENSQNILDLGCGFGLMAKEIADKSQAKLLAIDQAQAGFMAHHPRVIFKQLDIQSSSQRQGLAPAGPFDRVYAVDSLYGLRNHLSVLHDIFKLIRPGGKIIFSYTLFRLDHLDLSRTEMGQALDQLVDHFADFNYAKINVTNYDLSFWQNSDKVLEEMATLFEFGEDFGIWHIKRKEATQHLRAHADEAIKKYIIVIQKQAQEELAAE